MKEKKFLTARNDRVFKNIFLNIKNKDILEAVLSEALGEKIEVLQIRNNELVVNNAHVKMKTIDALIASTNKLIEIEVNNEYEDKIKKRNACFLFTIYNSTTSIGNNYVEDKLVVQINLSYNKSNSPVFERYYLQTEDGTKWVHDLEILSINMEKLKKLCYDKKEEEKYKHLLMLDYDLKDLEEKSEGDRIMEKFEKEVKKVNLIPEYQDFATEEEDREMMRNTELYYSEKKGREEGVKENKIETARNMLKKKFDIKDIIDITGLSKSEIEKLKEV